MSDQLVTLLTYEYLHQAEFVKSTLEEQGIKAFVADGNIVQTDWLLSNAVGFIKLQVHADDADAALEFLRCHPELMATPRAKALPPDADATCLACGQTMNDSQSTCPSCGWSYDATSRDT
jgi:rubrerythrin